MSKELFLGNLGRDVTRSDIETVFDKYGRVVRCDIKDKGNGAVFAFLEFEDERDAEDALKAENGKDMCGSSMVVEFAKGRQDRRDDRRGGGGYGDRRGYGGGGGYGDRRGGGGGGYDRDRRGGGGGFRGGDRGGGRSLECYNCGETGHFARDCRKGGSRSGGGDRGGGRRDDRRGDDRRGDDRRGGGGGGGERRERRHSSHSRSRSPSK